jgi:hypothetical protein
MSILVQMAVAAERERCAKSLTELSGELDAMHRDLLEMRQGFDKAMDIVEQRLDQVGETIRIALGGSIA